MGKELEPIKVSAGEDLLAFIPHIMGYWPQNSIVCIGMRGKQLRATMRLDLPPEGCGVQFARLAASQLASDAEADGCLIAVFGREDWQDPPRCPHADVFLELRKAFGELGLPVRDAWYVGTEYWRSMECQDPLCCPWPGRGNASIRESFVNAELVFRGSTVRESPQEQVLAQTATKDAGFADAVVQAGRKYRGALGHSGMGAGQLAATLRAWEHSLERWPETPDQDMTAYLLASVQERCVRDTLMVALATTAACAFAGAGANGLLRRDEEPPMVPATRAGGSLVGDCRTIEEGTTADVLAKAGRDFGIVLMGGAAASGNSAGHPTPNWARLDRSEPLLRFLACSARGEVKAPVLCILGWIQWCKGRGTWAGSYFAACEQQQPGYKLASMLDDLLSVGYIAEWAKNAKTAWRGYRDEDELSEDAA